MKKALITVPVVGLTLALAGWGGLRAYRQATVSPVVASTIPTTAVRRGDVTFKVISKGELVGGNS
jgi:hypothetical protein